MCVNNGFTNSKKLDTMNKKYIAPATSVVNTNMESHILSGSLQISETQVDGGWAKEDTEAGEWGDIWDEE